jgi:hypothetical protein
VSLCYSDGEKIGAHSGREKKEKIGAVQLSDKKEKKRNKVSFSFLFQELLVRSGRRQKGWDQ